MPNPATRDIDEFYDECVQIIASRTQTIMPKLCYYPLGWKLDAWHEFVDNDMKENLPAIPQLDHLLDPYQGSTKAVKAGHNRETSPRPTQLSQMSWTGLISPSQDDGNKGFDDVVIMTPPENNSRTVSSSLESPVKRQKLTKDKEVNGVKMAQQDGTGIAKNMARGKKRGREEF